MRIDAPGSSNSFSTGGLSVAARISQPPLSGAVGWSAGMYVACFPSISRIEPKTSTGIVALNRAVIVRVARSASLPWIMIPRESYRLGRGEHLGHAVVVVRLLDLLGVLRGMIDFLIRDRQQADDHRRDRAPGGSPGAC